ncbi:MAG: SDR family NAD(P)-dependent oxidoreductase [Candidatus Hydrogenedentota bacterium]
MTPQQGNRVFMVTGATGTIGQVIARLLAEDHAHDVVLAARNEDKAQKTAAAIQKATGNTGVRYELVDVARKQSVEALRARWAGPLHVLVNNAGQSPPRREETVDGIERQFATNVLGYFWMMQAFEDILRAHAPARIVCVASYYAGGLDLADPEFKKRRYDNHASYRASKQADRMLAAAFAKRLTGTGVTVNACHPGDVPSKLSSDLGFGGHESPEEGAATPFWVATAPAGAEQTGKYFAHQREEADPFTKDGTAVERLVEICAAYGDEGV